MSKVSSKLYFTIGYFLVVCSVKAATICTFEDDGCLFKNVTDESDYFRVVSDNTDEDIKGTTLNHGRPISHDMIAALPLITGYPMITPVVIACLLFITGVIGHYLLLPAKHLEEDSGGGIISPLLVTTGMCLELNYHFLGKKSKLSINIIRQDLLKINLLEARNDFVKKKPITKFS